MDPRFTALLAPFLKHLHGREITEESPLPELGLDSMQSIELLFAIEDAFGVPLPDEDLNDATFATAGSLWTAVRAARAAHEGSVGAP
ncbi:acyl carrier protein [Streptomyces sp. XM4011]|uniref:Acyl carrier protein n=2 Tax=Streptomyces TaxID=1883 RepID=A0A1I6RW33_9ACTN|nr:MULTISPECIES: acyl carrier protein [Streptomyces]MCK1814531.1 acyl carrier protein [Streptomyces sp. XM4011]QKV68308.1 acyl carrier protein [Streptomyces harbinensis]SFS68892.1 acyl carrier protein [Streptomyces harbinensis]